jgi:hypothetical protein
MALPWSSTSLSRLNHSPSFFCWHQTLAPSPLFLPGAATLSSLPFVSSLSAHRERPKQPPGTPARHGAAATGRPSPSRSHLKMRLDVLVLHARGIELGRSQSSPILPFLLRLRQRNSVIPAGLVLPRRPRPHQRVPGSFLFLPGLSSFVFPLVSQAADVDRLTPPQIPVAGDPPSRFRRQDHHHEAPREGPLQTHHLARPGSLLVTTSMDDQILPPCLRVLSRPRCWPVQVSSRSALTQAHRSPGGSTLFPFHLSPEIKSYQRRFLILFVLLFGSDPSMAKLQ